jgi:hypothetical protein
MLQKLYPSCAGAPLASSFKLIFLAEGFASRVDFLSACADFYDWLLATPPFNVTRFGPGWLTVFGEFTHPPVPIATGPSTANGAIALQPGALTALMPNLTVREHGVTRPLSDIFPSGFAYGGWAGGLIVVLLPSGGVSAAQVEHMPGAGEYHFIAVTTDAYWEQLVARTIAHLLGLEEEHGGPAQAPVTPQDKAFFGFNVDYRPNPPGIAAENKWRVLGANSATPAPAAATPDSYPTTPDGVAYWEGAGGFQSEVYRTAKDCLMRRRLSDPSSSLRARRVPFCLACRTALLWRIASL